MELLENRSIRSFVLRAGRMSDAQRRSYEKLSPLFLLPYEKKELSFSSAFGSESEVFIEIGFGMGLATAAIAESNPDKSYLGLEVHTPGIGRLLWEIEGRSLTNIRIIEYDAVAVLEDMIEDGTVSGFHVFFPDPWPKKRHNKRRLIKRPFTDLLARRLKEGGYLYMATDWAEYGDWALEELEATPDLKNEYKGFAPRQAWRPETKFERKGLDKEHELRELFFRKKSQKKLQENNA
ncbi:tRNA (guanosine(46)-N7)-methyltransferase TrmB [Treponema sp.]